MMRKLLHSTSKFALMSSVVAAATCLSSAAFADFKILTATVDRSGIETLVTLNGTEAAHSNNYKTSDATLVVDVVGSPDAQLLVPKLPAPFEMKAEYLSDKQLYRLTIENVGKHAVAESGNSVKITLQPVDLHLANAISEDASFKIENATPANGTMNIDLPLTPIGPETPVGTLKTKTLREDEQDTFSLSGYTKQRVTLDFHATDLQNVFNFIQEASGKNIIVDDTVTGKLTMSLKDVPWEFALDAILHLKDLEKVDKYGTIIIYTPCKGTAQAGGGSKATCRTINWKDQNTDNLTIETKVADPDRGKLVVKESQAASQGETEAKKLLRQAMIDLEQQKIDSALVNFERSLELWPENTDGQIQLAELYLQELDRPEKAASHSDHVLMKNPKHLRALELSAVAYAKIGNYNRAEDCFRRATAVKTPAAAALMNYAAFSEAQRKHQNSLTLLEKHDALYGPTYDSLLSKARQYEQLNDRISATKAYTALLSSGFQVPEDLRLYIKGRIVGEEPRR